MEDEDVNGFVLGGLPSVKWLGGDSDWCGVGVKGGVCR